MRSSSIRGDVFLSLYLIFHANDILYLMLRPFAPLENESFERAFQEDIFGIGIHGFGIFAENVEIGGNVARKTPQVVHPAIDRELPSECHAVDVYQLEAITGSAVLSDSLFV